MLVQDPPANSVHISVHLQVDRNMDRVSCGATRTIRGDRGRHGRHGATWGDTRDPGRHGATRGTPGDRGRQGRALPGSAQQAGRAPSNTMSNTMSSGMSTYRRTFRWTLCWTVRWTVEGNFPRAFHLALPGVPGRHTARGATQGGDTGAHGGKRAPKLPTQSILWFMPKYLIQPPFGVVLLPELDLFPHSSTLVL